MQKFRPKLRIKFTAAENTPIFQANFEANSNAEIGEIASVQAYFEKYFYAAGEEFSKNQAKKLS